MLSPFEAPEGPTFNSHGKNGWRRSPEGADQKIGMLFLSFRPRGRWPIRDLVTHDSFLSRYLMMTSSAKIQGLPPEPKCQLGIVSNAGLAITFT